MSDLNLKRANTLRRKDLDFSEQVRRIAGNPTPEMRDMWARLEIWAGEYPTATGARLNYIQKRFKQCLPDTLVAALVAAGSDPSDYMFDRVKKAVRRNERLLVAAWKVRATSEFAIKSAPTADDLINVIDQVNTDTQAAEADYVVEIDG